MRKNKILIVLLALIIMIFAGCKKEPLGVSVIVPNGMPFIAIANVEDDTNVSIENVDGPVALRAAFVANEYDIIVAPLNLGAQLYVKGNSTYTLDSVIGFKNTFIISKEGIKLDSINDLENKKILAYSQGGVPDVVLKYALEQNNVNCTIEYQNSLTEVLPFFINNTYDYILAAEPVISKLEIERGISLNKLDLEDCMGEMQIMQAAIFVKNDEEKAKNINKALEMIKSNIEEMNENVTEYAEKIIDKDVYFSDLTLEVLKGSITNGNLKYVKATEAKTSIESFLQMLKYDLPDAKFYR